ncbi:MAG: DUF6470 family protein [Clostridia bacterium]|nr:DUF6470 family protein [Clostridia bacterium]
MAISISQSFARIGMDTVRANLSIQTQNSRMEIHQKHAKLKIDAELPKVKIDQHDSFSSAGLKSTPEIIREAAQLGQQAAMQYIGKVVSDGNMMAAIESGVNAIAEIAARDSYEEKQINLGTLPSVRPKIEVTGSLQIELEGGPLAALNSAEINFVPAEVNINYTPGKVNIYLTQQASLSIRYVGNHVDAYA